MTWVSGQQESKDKNSRDPQLLALKSLQLAALSVVQLVYFRLVSHFWVKPAAKITDQSVIKKTNTLTITIQHVPPFSLGFLLKHYDYWTPGGVVLIHLQRIITVSFFSSYLLPLFLSPSLFLPRYLPTSDICRHCWAFCFEDPHLKHTKCFWRIKYT